MSTPPPSSIEIFQLQSSIEIFQWYQIFQLKSSTLPSSLAAAWPTPQAQSPWCSPPTSSRSSTPTPAVGGAHPERLLAEGLVLAERVWCREVHFYDSFRTGPAVDLPAVKSFIRQAGLTKCVIRDMECSQQEQESEDCLDSYQGLSSVKMRRHILKCLLARIFTPFEDAN
eukprot:g69114.t1